MWLELFIKEVHLCQLDTFKDHVFIKNCMLRKGVRLLQNGVL